MKSTSCADQLAIAVEKAQKEQREKKIDKLNNIINNSESAMASSAKNVNELNQMSLKIKEYEEDKDGIFHSTYKNEQRKWYKKLNGNMMMSTNIDCIITAKTIYFKIWENLK